MFLNTVRGNTACIILKLIVISYCILHGAAEETPVAEGEKKLDLDTEYKVENQTESALNQTEKTLDIKAEKFCLAKCGTSTTNLQENVACECKDETPDITIVMDNLVPFREHLLDFINSYRDKVASGELSEKGLPQAADMQVINYSVRLEYIAACALKRLTRLGIFANLCKRTFQDELLKSSGWTVSGKYFLNMSNTQEALSLLKSEIDKFKKVSNPGILQKYSFNKPVEYYPIIFAAHRYIGCARSTIASKKKNFLGCLYEDGGHEYFNRQNIRILQEGPPCSKCGFEIPCNTKYTHLCGKLEPVPTYGYSLKPNPVNRTKNAGMKGAVSCVNNAILAFLFAFLLNNIC